ncbi:DUF2782 domain-containing protein [Kaarinaea lacus]
MIRPILLITFLFLWLTVQTVHSQETAQEAEQENPPAEGVQESPGKVTIKEGKDEVISEFRINGQLYMIRITPRKGVPYYLVDSDGDGNLETRWNELAPDILIPAWVLLRW